MSSPLRDPFGRPLCHIVEHPDLSDSSFCVMQPMKLTCVKTGNDYRKAEIRVHALKSCKCITPTETNELQFLLSQMQHYENACLQKLAFQVKDVYSNKIGKPLQNSLQDQSLYCGVTSGCVSNQS